MPRRLHPTSRPQRLKTRIYLGREPYFYPPLSESAVVYGRLPSMDKVGQWVDDVGEVTLDTVYLGCGNDRDRLTANYATVLCGTLTEEEAAHIEVTRGAISGSEVNNRNVKVARGSDNVDMSLVPRFDTLALDTNGLGNRISLTLGGGREGTSNRDQPIPGDTTHRHERCICQHNLPRFIDVSDDHDDLFPGHSGTEITYRVPPPITATETDEKLERYHQPDDEDITQRRDKTVLNHYPRNNQGPIIAKHSNTFQNIISADLTKLEAAHDVWSLRVAESEITRLMLKEIEYFNTTLSQDNPPYAVAPMDMQLNLWKISVEGPPHTPYDGGIFEIEIDIGVDWQVIKSRHPVKSISDIEGRGLKILTQIIHPDITNEGEARNLESIYALIGFNLDLIAKTFIDMLLYPERVPKYLAARPDLADLAKEHPNVFEDIAKQWTQEHAKGKSSDPLFYGRLR